MSGITWFEKNDRPCRLNISGSDISTALVSFNESKQATVDFDCSGIGLGAFSTSSKTVSATAARPINQLRVCNRVRTNPTRTLTRLKGIEIHGAKIGLDNASNAGDVVSDQESMPNCDYWGQLLSCPAGAYATGLVLEGDDVAGDGRAEIKGMRLICHSVGVR